MLIFFFPLFFLFSAFSLFLLLFVFFKGFTSRFSKLIMRCDLVLYFWLSVLILILTLLLFLKLPNNLIVSNSYFSLFFSNFAIVFIIFIIIILLFVLISFWKDSWLFIQHGFLFLIFVQILLLAVIFLAFSNDLFLMFLSLELFNMVLFILFSFRKFLEVFLEALLKLFWLNTLSASFFLISLCFFYFGVGSLLLSDLEFFFTTLFLKNTNSISSFNILSDFYNFNFATSFLILNTPDIFLIFLGSFFFFLALSIKLGIFPLHNWVIDVVQGCPYSFLPFYYIISKSVYFFIFIKIFRCLFVFFNQFVVLGLFFIILSLCGILYLIFLNLHQITLKRLFAISGIVQYCYIYFILSAFNVTSIVFALILFFFYLLNSFALFFSLANFRKIYDNRSCHKLAELCIFSNSSNNFARISLTFFFFIFIGVPPFIGFIFKIISSIFFCYLHDSFFFISLFLLLLFSSIIGFIYVRCIIFLNTITTNILPINITDISFIDTFVIYIIFFGNLLFICYAPIIIEFVIISLFFSF